MKENVEEDIKMIEILKNKNLYINIKPKSSICIDCINKNKNKHIEAEVVINEKLEEAINYTLSNYKRVLKENEELKKHNEKYIIHLTDEQYKIVIENAQNDINQKWIQKVKDKIEELNRKINNGGKTYGRYGGCVINSENIMKLQNQIEALKELLEGRK